MATKAEIISRYMAELATRRKGTKNPGVAAYWANMSPEERTVEMKRRAVKRAKKKRLR